MFSKTTFANVRAAARNHALSVAKSAITGTKITVSTMFTLTALAAIMEVFSAPSGFAGVPVFFLPALSGIAVGIAATLLPRDTARFWLTFTSVQLAVGSAAYFAWCAQDASDTRLTGWISTQDSLYVSPLTVSLAYATLAALSALTAVVLHWLSLSIYREVHAPLQTTPA